VATRLLGASCEVNWHGEDRFGCKRLALLLYFVAVDAKMIAALLQTRRRANLYHQERE
jgi:hypothetical protein